MGRLTGEWKKVNDQWFQKEIITRWVKYVEIPCVICKTKFKTRHEESIACSKKCSAVYRWKRTKAEDRWTVTVGKIHNGYKMIHVPGIPRLVYEHRYIAEQKEKRTLRKNEVVHHINGNRLDNHPDNLVVISRSDHNILHKVKETGDRKRNGRGEFT